MEEKQLRAIRYGMQAIVRALEKEQLKTALHRAIRVQGMIDRLHRQLLDAPLTSRSSRAAGAVPFGKTCHITICPECVDTECVFKPPPA